MGLSEKLGNKLAYKYNENNLWPPCQRMSWTHFNASQDCAGGSGVQSKHILGPRHTAVKRRAASRDVIIHVQVIFLGGMNILMQVDFSNLPD